MGKILILYDSLTGATEEMAKFVKEGAESFEGCQMSIRVRKIDDASASDVEWCDGLALGSPTNLGVMSGRMKMWWDKNAEKLWSEVDDWQTDTSIGKIATCFSSAGGYGGGAEMACLSMTILMINFGFLCFGCTDYVNRKFTSHYGATVAKKPRNEAEQEACRRIGLRLCEWVAVYVDGRKEFHPSLTTKNNGAWNPNSGYFDEKSNGVKEPHFDLDDRRRQKINE